MTWRVVFEGMGVRVKALPVRSKTGDKDAIAVVGVFGEFMREAMLPGGCRSFTVTVHPDGPDCDHEVTVGGKPA